MVWRWFSSWSLGSWRQSASNWIARRIARDSGRWRRAGIVLGTIVSVGLAGLAAHAFDVHVNWTDSMPRGVYQRVEARLERGSWVVFCLDEVAADRALERRYVARGACPSGVQPIFKRIAAVPGDRVAFGASGVAINGAQVADSGVLSSDTSGRPLGAFTEGEIVVADDHFFVLGTNLERSWDSRYFGPVAISQITGSAAPVWTF